VLTHPFIGHRTVTARDMNDAGVFAWFPDAPFKIGSHMDVTIKHANMIESRPTPTVKMKVLRVQHDGIALGFVNKSGAHLWQSAGLHLEELQVGKDLFRVHQTALVRDNNGKILSVQQNGRWLFPGCWLETSQSMEATLCAYLATTLNLTDAVFLRTVLTHTDPELVARENSTLSVFCLYGLGTVDPNSIAPVRNSPYTKACWIENQLQLEEMSFSAEPLRALTRSLLHADDATSNASPDSPTNSPAGTASEQAPHPIEETPRRHG